MPSAFRHSAVMMNRVRRSGPPSISANGARFSRSSTRCRTSPPSATRTIEYPPVGDPDRAFGVEADAVGAEAVGEDSPVGSSSVCVDIERGEPAGERLGDDQRPVVGRDDHAVGELDVGGDLA